MPAGKRWTPELAERYREKIRKGLGDSSLPTTSAELGSVIDTHPTTLRGWIGDLGMRSEVEIAYAKNNASRREQIRGESIQVERPNSAPKNAPSPEIVGAGSAVEPDIEAIRTETARRFRDKARRAERKQHQTIRFSHGPVAIVFCGDQHIGNAGTDVDRIFAEQEMVLATPGSYVWQMGDVVDQFILGRLIAENWKPSLPVQEQWWLAEEYMRGFVDRLLAVNAGNHDAWAQKASGVDRMRDITPNGPLYDADTIRATIQVGHREFKVWTRHKWRGKSMYNMTHGQERGARFDDPFHDIYVGAHLHTGAVSREFVHAGSRKIAIQTGSYKIHDDYADAEGFPGHDASTACVLILHDDGSFHAMSDLRASLNFMRAVYK